MKNHNSCEKLIGVEEGILWSTEAKEKKSIAVWKRDENLTRCMKLLFACLSVVLLVLIFYHFRLSFMERKNTQNTIGSLEGMQTEKNTLTPNIITINTEEIHDDKVSDEDNDSSPESKPFFGSDYMPPTSWPPLPTLSEDEETTESSNAIDEEESEVPNPAGERENATSTVESYGYVYRILLTPFGGISFSWGLKNNEETESEITTTENVINVEEKDNHEETHPEIMIDNVSEYGYDYSAGSSYDYPSEEEFDYEYSSEPKFTSFLPEESEEVPKIIGDGEDVVPYWSPLSGWFFTFNSTFRNVNDINELSTTERISDGSSKQDDDVDDSLQIGETTDKYSRESEAEKPALVNSSLEREDDLSTETEYVGIYPDLWEEEDYEEVPISKPDEEMSQDHPSQDSSTVESSTTPNDNEDSQQVNTVTQNFESGTKSSRDSDETTDSLGDMDTIWMNDFLPILCEPFNHFTSEEIYFLFDVLSEAETDTINRCLSLKERGSDESLKDRLISKRSIADESVREEIGDHQSTAEAGRILAAIQKVIQQDREILTNKTSRISNPVVKSKMEDFYEKMEAVSAHIDQLHESYLTKNKLEDDYVSREFPPQA